MNCQVRYFSNLFKLVQTCLKTTLSKRNSDTGNRTRACWVRASYPNPQTMPDYILNLGKVQNNLPTCSYFQFQKTQTWLLKYLLKLWLIQQRFLPIQWPQGFIQPILRKCANTYMANHSNANIIVVEDDSQLQKILKVKSELPCKILFKLVQTCH